MSQYDHTEQAGRTLKETTELGCTDAQGFGFELLSRLADAKRMAQETSHEICEVANEIGGPVPTEADENSKEREPNSFMENAHQMIAQIQRSLYATRNDVERIRKMS